MTEFSPQISKRETDELIGIANSSTEHWQQNAIVQARNELAKRGITKEKQIKVIQKWNKKIKKAQKRKPRD